jgi:sterol 24-C-methyltransferase
LNGFKYVFLVFFKNIRCLPYY